tara:strand:- start:10320 stop:11003 length:684 start_codon:yes stop_codon:yes gene_type:complete
VFAGLTAHGEQVTFDVSGYARDINYAASSRSMGKNWVKKQAEENLKSKANSICASLKSKTEDIYDIDLSRVQNGHTYEYTASGKVNCNLSAVGSCSLKITDSNSLANYSVGVQICESANSEKLLACSKGFVNRPAQPMTRDEALIKLFINSSNTVGAEAIKACEVAVLRRADVIFKVLLQTTLDDSYELLRLATTSVDNLGLSEAKKMIADVLRKNGVAEKYLIELL